MKVVQPGSIPDFERRVHRKLGRSRRAPWKKQKQTFLS